MQSNISHIANQNEFAKATAENEWILVDFYATWCGPCKSLAPVFEEVADDYQGKLYAAKVDIDQYTELANQFNVRGVPTLALLHHGEPVSSIVGAHSRSSIVNWIDKTRLGH